MYWQKLENDMEKCCEDISFWLQQCGKEAQVIFTLLETA